MHASASNRPLRIGRGLAVAATLLVLALAPSSASAAGLALDSPNTDNYKTWTTDPNVWDYRTYLSSKAVTAGGVRYENPARPASISFTSAGSISLRGSDGSAATATFSSPSTNLFYTIVRMDPSGSFGPMIGLRDRTLLPQSSVPMTMTLTRDGQVLGTASLEYRHDPAVAAIAAPHVEFHSPGGRWYIDGTVTRLDWEQAAPTQQVTDPVTTDPVTTTPVTTTPVTTTPVVTTPVVDRTAPKITSFRLPLRVSNRRIRLYVPARDNVRVTQVRFANEDGNYGGWRRWSPTMYHVLTRGATYKRVYVQVRDARGNISDRRTARTRCTRCA